jgi:hypothetical protein
MLYEILNAKKFEDGNKLRWFSSNYFDLKVSYNDDKIFFFQLTYNKIKNPHALSWHIDKGFLHEEVDDGEEPGRFKKSPILLPDGIFHSEVIAEKFKNESAEIDQSIAKFIYKKINIYKV